MEPPGNGHQHHNSELLAGTRLNSTGIKEETSGQEVPAPKRVYRRSYKACLNCRERKVRCDLGDLSAPLKPPCLRCRREGRECVFGPSKRGGVNNVRSGLQKKAALAAANANGNGDEKGEKKSEDTKEKDPISGRELHNTTDALEILAHAARSFPKISDGTYGFSNSKEAKPLSKDGAPGGARPFVESSAASRNGTPLSVRLADSALIAREKLLSEDEAKQLINYFFDTLHPFYPFIPKELHDPDKLAEMPILLAAITTLASRYYIDCFSDSSPDRGDVHAQLWDHCQALFSKTVWAEASTRSIGTVFAFLIFSEWNPRAIHQRWHDYANDANDPSADASTSGGGQGDGITGFGASRRSDRMSWMLIGNAIRLAQDLGYMETQSKVFLATHLSEIVLSLRMGRRSMLHQSLNEPVPEDLEFSNWEQAKLGLLQIMSLAHETLYGSRKTTRELLKNGSYLTFLSLFGPHLDNWERTCRDLLRTEGLERENILFDYHYARLYIYSLALSCSAPEAGAVSNVAEIIPSSRYVGMATDAAKEMLACANRVHEMGRLGQAPIRWVVRIVHATIFLVKSIMLTPASSLEAHKHTLSLVRNMAQTLHESSPDDVHLSSRFGSIMMTLQQRLVATMGLQGEYDEDDAPPSSANDDQQDQTVTDFDQLEQQEPQQQQQQQQQAPPQAPPGATPQAQQQQQQHQPQQQMFDFSRYSFQTGLDQDPSVSMPQNQQNQNVPQQQHHQPQPQIATQQQQQQQSNYMQQLSAAEDQGQNLMSMMDMDFDFLMEGTEGLGFVEPLMEGIEQHQMMQRQQQ